MGLAMEGTLIMPVLLIVIVAVIILIAIMRSASKSNGMLVASVSIAKTTSTVRPRFAITATGM